MSTVVKDLGAVSAYAYAVEKGYTGTEAEFAELMASYAEVGQTATDAAESALNSKTAAQTAATTATNKASEATTAAQTATTKAGEASQSATAAAASAASITTPDATLTQAGVAADAQAVGNTFSSYDNKLKNDFYSFSSFNTWGIIKRNGTFADSTSSGITFTWNDGICTANGTASALATNIVYNNPNKLPEGIEAGKTYKVYAKISNENLFADVRYYSAGSDSKLISYLLPTVKAITIPSNATGLLIRFRVNSGATVSNDTAQIELLHVSENLDGWIFGYDINQYDESNKIDMLDAITDTLNTVGYCHLSEGVFYVSGGIDMPPNTMLCGCGDKTQIRLMRSATSDYCIKLNDFCTVKDLSILGEYDALSPTVQGTRNGILFTGGLNEDPRVTRHHCVLDNLIIRKFNGVGILCDETSLSPQDGLFATNLYIENCYAGIYIDEYSEFNKFTNICTYNCFYGVINNSGNNVFTACTFRASNTGFYLNGAGFNNAHGVINGCSFAHIGNNDGSAIKIENSNPGFIISNCQFWFNTIDLINCSGIVFSGCEIGKGIVGTNDIINITDGNTIMFNGCIFSDDTPKINITNNTKVKFDACYSRLTGSTITG